MYLKEIEILGFKSFADKLTISLDKDITCIVGPNGSGKSNIVDAVRWVLGEQSVKSLRGDGQMSDVIFQGSKNRNPLNVASVTLTFDNSDNYLNLPYNNISVKRRLYRNGDNEYFLNGEKCRLKDITELFLDSGIGKSSFNIISQGEISKILSNSPQERRSIIEASAGILKYKNRREEAIKKLEKTNDNIDRINDILNEIEERVEPLREQSTKAKEYLKIKDELKHIEVGLLVEEIDNFNKEYQANKEKINILNEEEIKINTLLSNTIIDSLKVKEINIEKEIEELNKEILNKTKEEEKLNGKRNILKERSKYDANDIKVYENISLLNENKLKSINEIELLKKDLEDLKSDALKYQNNVLSLTENLSNLKVKKDNLYKEYNLKNREYLENINKINILKDNLANRDGLNNSIKKILNNFKLNGIHDVFGNILEVDKKYGKALEVIIASIKNNIIVDNPEAARSAIDYLKENNLGRATFYPISVMKPRGIDPESLDILERQIDYLGLLSDFVKYEDEYRNIVLNQLGNVIVVSDLISGNSIAKSINNRYRIVTVDGDIINVGGSMTGGSNQTGTSPISIKNELSDLTIKNNSNEIILKNLKEEIDNVSNLIIDCENNLYNERSNNIKKLEDSNNLAKIIEEKQEILEDINQELSNLNSLKDNNLSKEEENLQEEYYNVKKDKELLMKDIKLKTAEKENIKNEIINNEASNKVNNSNLKNIEKEKASLELQNNKLEYKLDNNLNTLNNDYELTYEKAREEYIIELEIEEARKIVNKNKSILKEIGMVNLDSIEEFEKVNERFTFLNNQRDDLLKAKDTLYSIIEEMDTIMKEDFKNTFLELEVEFQKVFKELFKGGNASLKLTDPTNLLETGVDIEACPPGKALKSINLLSGGEKTLTAISLLFAILNVRKVPFCIFDEVEAALDEANVDVFGHYLDNYKEKTQFMLITHKKRTMEYAGTLYGITMQESGVSKLVSVKLEN